MPQPDGKVVQLFRPEVTSVERSKLHGDIHVFNSTPWNVVFYIVAAIFAVLSVVVAAVPFPRVIVVQASLSPDRGIATITASRNGVLSYFSSRQGETVEMGAVVATLDVTQSLPSGASNERQVAAALAKQVIETEAKLETVGEQAKVDAARLDQKATLSQLNLRGISQQIALQNQLIAQAQLALDRAEALSAKGYVTKIYLDSSRENLLSKKQRLSELMLELEGKRQEASDAALERRSALLSAKKDQAALRIEREELNQRLANNSLAGRYAITAPITGSIGNVRFRVGQSIEAGAAIADIVPATGALIVELQAPTASITSIAVGQEVLVSFDAMPSQTFGTLKARVERVSSTTTVKQGAAPYYTVTAVIDRARTNPAILQALRPGLTGSASVVAERKTILSWLLKPFLQK